jgi:hypothetical protein
VWLPIRAHRQAAPSGLSAHARDSYQVTIAIPKFTNGQSCMAGRTGRVYFDGGALEVAAVAAADRL